MESVVRSPIDRKPVFETDTDIVRSISKRLDGVRSSLTPKQAVLLWMEEAHQFDSMEEYVVSLLDEPDSAYPLYRLPEQVEDATRNGMKGSPKPVTSEVVRDSVRDVIFLFFLHQESNKRIRLDERPYSLQALLLSTEMRWLNDRRTHHRDTWDRRRKPRTSLADQTVSDPVTRFNDHLHGWTRDGTKSMYVAAGIGTSVVPMRFKVPPEVVLITLRSRTV